MRESRQFLLIAGLALLAGIGLRRFVGDSADPVTAIAVLFFVQASWRAYRHRKRSIRRAVRELRPYHAEDRVRLVDTLESEDLRDEVGRVLAREETEYRDGLSEVFPYPVAFRRRAKWRFAGYAATAVSALLVGALVPPLSTLSRVGLLVVGAYFLLRARKMMQAYRALDAVIEINPYRISYVGANGQRATILFAKGATCEDRPAAHQFVVRSGEILIPVSYQMMGFNRITELVEQYGARIPSSVPPAS